MKSKRKEFVRSKREKEREREKGKGKGKGKGKEKLKVKGRKGRKERGKGCQEPLNCCKWVRRRECIRMLNGRHKGNQSMQFERR